MDTLSVGKELVELCRQGQNLKAIETLYAPGIVSVEAVASHGMPAEMKGIEAVLGKTKWWVENHEIHSASCEGPYPNGNRFAVVFHYNVTNKPSGQRFDMKEVALYTVDGSKITREEFFYAMG